MKLNQIITGIALVAGLLALAPSQAHAVAVATNTVIVPINIKAVGSYVSTNNTAKIVNFSYSNKDILKNAGAPKGAKLAFIPSEFGWGGDVVIISGKAVWEDLTTNGVLYISFSEPYSYNEVTGKNGGGKFAANGTVEIAYGSNGNDNTYDNNEYGFDVYGSYLWSGTYSAPKNGYINVSENISTAGVSGDLYDFDLNFINDGYFPASGSVSGSGSGKVVPVI